MLTLFGNLESGNVHKVAMLLHRLDVPYRRVDVAQPRGEPRHDAFLKLNPIGKVPAVLLDDGDVLTESGAILYYFAEGTPLWPKERRVRAEVLRWMFFEQYSHEPALAVMRYLRLFADGPEKYRERLEELRPKALHALSVLDRQLDLWKFVVAAEPTIADYALYPYTAWSTEAGVALDDFPNILRWLRQLEEEPRFLPLLKDGAAEVVTFAGYFGVTT
ncbi:MAG TPA: glutathione S-transferase family protein [Aestuariivirgaceae bacterium]|nr:glutathione S-transferase family protein [Aestuariivirgaceae bacterium]